MEGPRRTTFPPIGARIDFRVTEEATDIWIRELPADEGAGGGPTEEREQQPPPR